MAEATTSGRRWTLVAAIAAVAILAVSVAVAVLVVRDGDEGDQQGSSASGDEAVPGEVLSGPGTELGDGLRVAEGSSLIGPVVVSGTDDAGDVENWHAVVLVEGDPVAVWEDYAAQLSEAYPDPGIDPSQSPGCIPRDDNDGSQDVCHLYAYDSERDLSLSLRSVPGDVTGHYLVVLEGDVRETDYVPDDDVVAGPDEVPEPYPARERPGVGDPLAPVTAAYEDDDEEYVVVEGSELLAQYSAGSLTGGFDVLLRVRPDADLAAVVDAYVAQGDQLDDPSYEETPPPDVTEHQGTTVSEYFPPGGAGGYTGHVTVVDRPEGDDYIFFSLSND